MAIVVKRKDWDDPSFRNATLSVAEVLGEDIEVIYPTKKFYPFTVQLWIEDNMVEEKEFKDRLSALKWARKRLSLKKNSQATAELKKFKKTNELDDYWVYRLDGSCLVDITFEYLSE